MSERRRVAVVILGLRFALALAVFAVAELVSERVWPAAAGMPVWLVVVTMGALGVLFAVTVRPVRALAGRLVLGDQADGYEAGRELLHRMSTALPVEDVLPALAEITGRTLQVERSEVRVLLSGGQAWSQIWPAGAGPEGAPVVVEVRHDGGTIGEIEADVPGAGATNRERQLLQQLASPAGLAMSTVRLTVELQHRAMQLQHLATEIAESNRRIGRARLIEAERITAELRARVDPHLDSACDLVDRARDVVDDDPGGPPLIDRARDQVGLALDELRNLARRIYPPRLGDGGLAASLEGWQLSTGTGIDVRIGGDEPRLRADPAVESCLYFLIVAALDHRPPPGPRQSVTVEVLPDRAVVDIAGPAAGSTAGPVGGHTGPAAGPAGGHRMDEATAAAIRDRVDAFGGELTIGTADGRRSLRAWLPLERQD